jgi:hypothetical protein
MVTSTYYNGGEGLHFLDLSSANSGDLHALPFFTFGFELLDRKLPSRTPSSVQMMRCFCTAADFEPLSPKCIQAYKGFLVLEDLSAVGFRMLDRLQGLDLDHCLLVMRALAKFHAASVVLHQQDPDSMKEYEVNFFSETSIKDKMKRFFKGTWLQRDRNFNLDTIPLLMQGHLIFFLQNKL